MDRLWDIQTISFLCACRSSSEKEVGDHEGLYQQWVFSCYFNISGPEALSFPEKQPKNTATESVLPTHNLIKNWKTS